MSSTEVLGSWPASPAAVPAARHAVRAWMTTHDRESLLDGAELVVSELVGNVVLHVGGTVEVRMTTLDDGVLLEVVDGSAVKPHARSFSETASTGRGMRLVHSLSAAHGVRVNESGKTVWVRLTAQAASRSEDELLAEFADVVALLASDGEGPGADVVVLAPRTAPRLAA